MTISQAVVKRLYELCAQRNITINRKMQADIAVNDPAAFTKLVETVRG